MKICSKCNKEVTPGQLYCPRCGFSLIKNKYGERIGVGGCTSKIVTPEAAEKINATNMESNKGAVVKINIGGNNTYKNNPASIAVIVIIFIVSSFIPLLLTVFSSVKVTSESVTTTSKYNLDNTVSMVTTLLDDNLSVRKSFYENGSTDINSIADVTSLEKEDLTNAWCKFIASYNTEANAVLCVVTAHSDLGDDTIALSALDELYSNINSNYYDDSNYNKLINISDTLNDMYYLSVNSYDTYSNYSEKYNTLNDKLNNYINELE